MRKLLLSFFLILSGYFTSAQFTAPQVEPANITKTGFTVVVVPADTTNVRSIDLIVTGPGINDTTSHPLSASGFLSVPYTGLQSGSGYNIYARVVGCDTSSSAPSTRVSAVIDCSVAGPWASSNATTQVGAPPAATLTLTNNCPQFVGMHWSYPNTGGAVTNLIIKKSYGGPWYEVANIPPYETSYYDLDAQPGVHTTYVIYTQNELGEVTQSNQQSLQVMPYSAPAAPMNLHAAHKTNNSISLAWINPEEDLVCRSNIRESYYVTMKRAWETEFKIIGAIYPFSTSFDITGLEESETVEIGIFSWSDQGIQGGWAFLTEKTHGKSVIPTNVIGVGYKDNFDNWALGISWDHAGDDADYYEIDVSTDGTNWTRLATVKTGHNVIQHVNLSEGQQYTYRVKAGNYLYGESDYAYMDGYVSVDYSAVPNAPYGLKARWSGSDVVLSWVDDSNKEENFVIERAYTQNGTFEEVGEVGRSVQTFTDQIGSDTASAFFYRVKAVNPLGASAPTAAVKIAKSAGGRISVTVYPNPTADKLTVSVPSQLKADKVDVQVYNPLNQLVFTQSFKPGAAIEVNLKRFTPGIYNVVVSSGEFKETRKVVKN